MLLPLPPLTHPQGAQAPLCSFHASGPLLRLSPCTWSALQCCSSSPLPISSRKLWAQLEPAPPSVQPGCGIHSVCPLPLWGAHLPCPVVKCSLVKANPSPFPTALPRCAFWLLDGICSRKLLLWGVSQVGMILPPCHPAGDIGCCNWNGGGVLLLHSR